jgi:hypothetical protein
MDRRFPPTFPGPIFTLTMTDALVSSHAVQGVAVHDARLVAVMITESITHVLTLNPGDFSRYTQITTVTPADLIQSRSP